MRRSFFSRFIVYLLVCALAFGVTYGLLCLGDRRSAAKAAESADAGGAEGGSPQTRQDEPGLDAQPLGGTLSQTFEPTPTPVPEPFSITPPYHEQAAPDDYFEDALFIGNSLIEGLGIYSYMYDENISKATFDTATSLTVFGAGEYFEHAATGGYSKVYIGLGLNEIGFDHEAIREENRKIIDTIREGNPDAIIYLFSLTPISKYRSGNDSLYNNENAAKISQVLREVAEEKQCYYIDMVPVLAGSDGYLPSDVTTDGVHFVKEYYPCWYEYLQHNYVLP